MTVSRPFRLRMRNFSEKRCRENQNTHFIFNNIFPKIVLFVRRCGKNIVEPGRPDMATLRTRIAYCIPKATNTLRICNSYCFYTATVVARTCLNITLYEHCLPCYKLHWHTAPSFRVHRKMVNKLVYTIGGVELCN